MKHHTLLPEFFNFSALATPIDIGILPPTIADENTLYSGNPKDIDLPAIISCLTSSGGTPFSKHW